ncbi:methyl-accepting chemotaxis protein [Phaeobacter sp. QD34_3]|uniref:methyl-accepting chemotaxis protein n=1 Tax=unclassified Phaeobacter TaxID=2621772 RepID=UPI00237FC559|nr:MULTISPECIES: methyl-accepting chemotaxis protein [unclassified Phaeobacter]MDE4131638.1 methyl-accepting chemotaxis protein [Phaeobacter sp. QD34_3]MDE4135273.1 methyl-accepting chemotaxis protein [Phaeobacter sp. QD34_24]MDE4174594.1 methyl-accepting chemotaxis protein [Phaeobacter sp. PT47_59]
MDSIESKSKAQLDDLQQLDLGAERVVKANAQVMDTVGAVTVSAQQTLDSVRNSVTLVRESSGRGQEVAEWVQDLNSRTEAVADTVDAMRKDNEKITAIAAQVNILAINAKIEAGRAGDAGRGFAVVAEAINDLSKRTTVAASEISKNIEALYAWIKSLDKETETISKSASAILDQARDTDASLASIEKDAQHVNSETGRILGDATTVRDAMEACFPNINRIKVSVQETTGGIQNAHERIEKLVVSSERLVQGTIAAGGQSTDKKFITFVTDMAANISTLFEKALESGRITEADLFDRTYVPIPNTNPQQVMSRFTQLTDSLLPPLLESALDLDPRVVFSAAVDNNGYLPTHNKKFSHPQGPDPEWNMGNCRNRRIFDDRVGLKAGRNTGPFLMQVYRRDMGGGEFVMMKDLSSPITVKGRHWGGLRMAFTI